MDDQQQGIASLSNGMVWKILSQYREAVAINGRISQLLLGFRLGLIFSHVPQEQT
jgi:hypothetical protein